MIKIHIFHLFGFSFCSFFLLGYCRIPAFKSPINKSANKLFSVSMSSAWFKKYLRCVIFSLICIVVIVEFMITGILSQHSCSNSGDGEDELIENRYYGGFDIVDGEDFKNVGDDYAEVMEAKSVEPDLYTGIEENNERQNTEPLRYVEANKGRQAAQVEVYACVEKNKGRQSIQPELYATVVKFSGKEQAKTDNSRLGKNFANLENAYTIVDKGDKPESHVLSAPVEEMYAQVVKSPK